MTLRPVACMIVVAGGVLMALMPSPARALSNGFGDRYLLHLAVDPNDRDRLFASTQHNELMAGRDGGRTWQAVAAP